MQNKDSMKKMLLLPKMIANFKVHSYIKRERKNCLFVTTVLYTEYCHQLWLNMLGGIFSVILYADWIIRTESAYSKVNTHLLGEPQWYICILSAFLYPFIVCVCVLPFIINSFGLAHRKTIGQWFMDAMPILVRIGRSSVRCCCFELKIDICFPPDSTGINAFWPVSFDFA